MLSEKFDVKIQGFHPSDFAEEFIYSHMGELYKESPAGSVLHATFTRKGHEIKAFVIVQSHAGELSAAASGTGLHDVSHKIMIQMRKKFDRLKSLHHEHESIKAVQV
jgi:hypothetical protein